MSLKWRLVLSFAVVFGIGFAALGYGAVRISGETVERGLTERIELARTAIEANPAFFIHEASLRRRELAQLADLSGFEVVVLAAGEAAVAGSSLDPKDAEAAREGFAGSGARRAFVAGTEYRVARVRAAGRTLLLLAPEAPVSEAKARARRPILVVALFGLAVSIVLGTVLAGTVTRPLQRLAEWAGRVREGELDEEVPPGGSGEVRALSRAFAEMVEGLRRHREELISGEKLRSLGRFSAAVAHELRNPLSGMRMTVQMLRRSADGEAAREFDFLLSEMARLDHSVEELLFHAGEPRYSMVECDVREAVAATERALAPLAAHLGVALSVEAPPEPVRARADGMRLRQALMNLVRNALEASPAGGTVAVSVRGGDAVEVRVVDEGPGVPPEIAPRLFTAFTSGREGGTGLGLSNTRAIARAHGGDVTYGRRGGRTVFVLSIPAGEVQWPASS
jgi:signal transduction histidine kinase